jgi:hypothetical protein
MLPRVKDMNPRVEITVERTKDFAGKDDAFWTQFDLVIVTRTDMTTAVRLRAFISSNQGAVGMDKRKVSSKVN